MDLLQYKVWLMEDGWHYDEPSNEWRLNDNGEGYDAFSPNPSITTFECNAYTEHDAIAGAENRYPNCTIIACERMEYPSPF